MEIKAIDLAKCIDFELESIFLQTVWVIAIVYVEKKEKVWTFFLQREQTEKSTLLFLP